MAVGGRLVWNEVEYYRIFNSEGGPIGRDLGRKGEIVTQGAKRRAPVSQDGSHGRPSGYLRSQVGWELGKDAVGLYVDIASPARTPVGAPYGLFMEVGTKPHEIRIRRFHGMQLIDHPGTRPYPHLRPALDDVRGA